MQKTLLTCNSLVFGYKNLHFNAPMDFELREGEVVALMGANGCGKSTLLKTLAGEIPMLQGNILIHSNGINKIQNLQARDLARLIVLVRMGNRAPERMTVREFVSLGRIPYAGLFDGRSEEDGLIIDDSLNMLRLQGFEDRYLSSLSDGERSRAYLAEAIAQQVKVMLLDEPNAFLDIPHSHALFKLLKKLASDRSMGVVVSTHSIEYAERYCNRIMVIDKDSVKIASAENARRDGLFDWTEEICL